MEGLSKTTITLRIIGVLVEIQTGHRPNISLKRHNLSQLTQPHYTAKYFPSVITDFSEWLFPHIRHITVRGQVISKYTREFGFSGNILQYVRLWNFFSWSLSFQPQINYLHKALDLVMYKTTTMFRKWVPFRPTGWLIGNYRPRPRHSSSG
jgi:hypothetical protein